jgi:hydroxymethylpyrimidine/phosphomethylpyrimidine kinase
MGGPARPVVLALAGLDPCAGAGLTADVRTIASCGGRPVGVPTCLTVQNRHGFVEAWPVPVDRLLRMADAALADGPVAAIKIGLLVDVATIDSLAAWLEDLGAQRPRVVVDPVLSATAGGGPAAAKAVARGLVDVLAPYVDLFTPNLPELVQLGGVERIGSRMGDRGALLVTGGHADGEDVVDRLHHLDSELDFVNARLDLGPVHGTGCALSSAAATLLGRGLGIEAACEGAIRVVRSFLERTDPSVDGLPVPLAIESQAG